MMVESFSEAANKLKPGTITKSPVKSKFGYHIIYLENKTIVPTLEFEKAKNQIRQQVGQKKLSQRMTQLSDKLKAKAKIIYK
jgi:parvulin-like peptidyl-prolyl isomerase